MRRFALGYLFLLQQLLEHLCSDRGYADAARLIADFQADVAARVEAGHIDGHMLAYVGGALHQSKIPASPELAKASARTMTRLHNKSQWHRRARRQLQRQPLCEMCLSEGRIVAARIADHIEPHGFNIRVWATMGTTGRCLVLIFLILVLGSNEHIARKIIVPAEAGPPLGAQ